MGLSTLLNGVDRIAEDQRSCDHPQRSQENKLSPAGLAYTVCTACKKVLWMEDLKDSLSR